MASNLANKRTPLVESVVSPTASSDVIRAALGSIGDPTPITNPGIFPDTGFGSFPGTTPTTGGSPSSGGSSSNGNPPDTGNAPNGGDNSLASASADFIRKSIERLAASLGMTVDQLLKEDSAIGEQARRMEAQLEDQLQREQEQLVGSLLRRGLFHSGIALRENQRLTDAGLLKKDEIDARLGAARRDIESRRNQALLDFESWKAAIQADVANGNLDPEIAQALLNDLENITFKDLLAIGQEDQNKNNNNTNK